MLKEEESKAHQKKKMSIVTDEIRASASEIYHGDDICQVKSKFLLTETGLPNGLLPLQDIEECGYVESTGFVWLIQKKKCEHKFEKIDKLVKYATEVTAYVEPNRIKKLTGVKAKELLLWITLGEIYVDDPPTGKITFKSLAGLSRSYPVSAFEIEEKPATEDVKEKSNGHAGEVEEVVKDGDFSEVNGDKVVEVKEDKENSSGDAELKVKEVKDDGKSEVNGVAVEVKEVKDKVEVHGVAVEMKEV